MLLDHAGRRCGGKIGRRQARRRHGHHRHLRRGLDAAGPDRRNRAGLVHHVVHRMLDRHQLHALVMLDILRLAGGKFLGHVHRPAAHERSARDQCGDLG